VRLRCKVYPKHYDEIKAGHKNIEYRQFEDITLVDEKGGREMTLPIDCVFIASAKIVMEEYPDVPWDNKKQIIGLVLWRNQDDEVKDLSELCNGLESRPVLRWRE
jgi:hypothetical protein